jgi:tetratricopeptide (TPR) repeat protein
LRVLHTFLRNKRARRRNSASRLLKFLKKYDAIFRTPESRVNEFIKPFPKSAHCLVKITLQGAAWVRASDQKKLQFGRLAGEKANMARKIERIFAGAALLVTAILPISPVFAQTQQQLHQCLNNIETFSLDLRIGGCTALIQSGRLEGENLSLAYYNRGIAYFKKSQYDRAIADFDQAIRLNTNYAITYINRGSAFARKGQLRPCHRRLRPGASTRSQRRKRDRQSQDGDAAQGQFRRRCFWRRQRAQEAKFTGTNKGHSP